MQKIELSKYRNSPVPVWTTIHRIMRITFFLTLICVFNANAGGYSQERLTLKLKDVSLSKIFQIIQQRTDYQFLYNNEDVQKAPPVTVKVKNATVPEILADCFKGYPLIYRIENKTVVVSQRPGQVFPETGIGKNIPQFDVSGKVRDESGNALAGVSVTLKGNSTVGTTTDSSGNYSLSLENGEGTLIFTSVGFAEQEIAVRGRTTIDVMMNTEVSPLEQVVIVAYGQSKKRDINSSISTLNMKDVAPIPVQSINDAVGGRIPGMIVTASSGAPGAKSAISIRGGAAPLFVIDGIIRSQNDFENLDPNDVAAYSVLKDASATSLYGARGGNGVILITTKQGTEGKASINYSFNQILSQPTVNPDQMSSYDHALAVNKVYSDEGKTPPTPDDILQFYKDQTQPFVYPNTNWRDLFLKTFAPEQRHDLSVTSGTRKLTYYASGSYYHQGTILETDRNFNDRITYRLNTESHFDNIGLTVNTGIDGFVEKNETPNSSTANSYFGLFSHIQDKGANQLAYNNLGLPSANTTDNPAVELSPLSGYNRNTSRIFNSILNLDWAIPWVKDLHLKGRGSYNMWNSMGKSWNATAPSYNNNSTAPIQGNPPSLSELWGEGSTLTLQGFLTYSKQFGAHQLDFTGVYEQQQSKSSNLSGSRQQYQIIFDQFLAGPTENMQAGGGETESATASYLGRISYNYASRYFLDATFRRDGMDLFPPGKRWGSFYAFAGGWIVSSEKFFQPLKDNKILNYLKLRASTGLTGTVDGIGSFQYVPGYSIDANAWVVGGQLQQGTSEPGSLPSTNFSWFSIRSWDLGLDFETLSGRLSGSVDYFYKRTTGYVAPDTRYSAPLGIGLPPINDKDAALRRAGADFEIRWKDRAGDFNYQLGVNFTYFDQLWERTYWEDEAALKDPYTRTSGTSDAALQTGYESEGYYQNNGDLLKDPRRISSVNVVAGDLRYVDANGDGKIDGSDFRRVGSNTFPRINYGFTFDLSYKGIYLNGVLMGSGNRDRYLGDVIQGSSAQAQLVYAFQRDYWRPDNQSPLFPRAVSSAGVNGNNNFVTSDFWLLRSQYLRLKYVQLGYDLKYSLLKSTPFKDFKVFFSGTNLLTSAKSLNYFIDPESDANNYNYPIVRTIAFGVSIGF